MKLSVIGISIIIAVGPNTAALAGPEPGTGADKLCVGFDQSIEGVWKDPSGAEVLLFRLARDESGSGCYAWLNSVPQWNIGSPGSSVLKNVTLNGTKWSADSGSFKVDADTASGSAVYERGGRKTKGKLF